MHMPVPDNGWTAEMVRALPDDGKRYEVLDGELFVTPSPVPPHQRAVRELLIALAAYTKANDIGEAFDSPADIEFSPRRLVQPDVFVVPKTTHSVSSWRDVRTLRLAVEVLSPTTARADRHRKRLIYQSEGVGEYWIVDLDARVVERWLPGDDRPEILAEALRWQPSGAPKAFYLDLASFFNDVIGESEDR